MLTAEEWKRLDEKELRARIPFAQLLALVPWALHEVPAATREVIFTQPGGRLHRALWVLTRGRFRRRERIAFRHLA